MIEPATFKNLDKELSDILVLLAKKEGFNFWVKIKKRKKCYVFKCVLCNHKIYRGHANFEHAVYFMGEHGKIHVEKYIAFL